MKWIALCELMDGDTESGMELYGLTLEQLEPEHIQDFFGWYLLRAMSEEVSLVDQAFLPQYGHPATCNPVRLSGVPDHAHQLTVCPYSVRTGYPAGS